MTTKLIPIGNSYGIRLPKSVINQFSFNKGDIEILIKEEGILITPVSHVAPLKDWDALFKKAQKHGFNAEEDAKEFADWDTTLADGL